MFRKITEKDRELYISYADTFYHTDAVNAPVPENNYRATFDELMRSDVYAEGYVFEYDGKPCGYALLAKTFSQEAGGLMVSVEELYIDPEYRSRGIVTEFFDWLKSKPEIMRLRLEVEDYNERAIRLYKRIGFEMSPYQQMIIDRK